MSGREREGSRTDATVQGCCSCSGRGTGCSVSPDGLMELVVRHCSPTLAGLKCGNLFRMCSSAHGIPESVSYLQSRLLDRGVVMRVLETDSGDPLLYVYRPDMLLDRLSEPGIVEFLSNAGYDLSSPMSLVDQMSGRFLDGVPHEIGIFLGYPLADVEGYIENGGRDCVCLGCWKAYSDPEGAERAFRMIRKCRRVYEGCLSRGTPIEKLAVRTRRQASVASCGSTPTCAQRLSCSPRW